MEFILLDDDKKAKYTERILEMMEESDNDFIPPLSSRSSTTQKNLSGETSSKGVRPYFEVMMKQKILGVFEDEILLGLISFIEDYVSEQIKEKDLPNIYLSTLVLSAESRGKGITKKLYGHLFDELYPDKSIFTRTWSTNVPHIKILDYFGFGEMLRIKNDRGNGIDTVYFEKRRK